MLSQSLNHSLDKAAKWHINFIFYLNQACLNKYFKSKVKVYLPWQNPLERNSFKKQTKCNPLGYHTMWLYYWLPLSNLRIAMYNDSVPACTCVQGPHVRNKKNVPLLGWTVLHTTLFVACTALSGITLPHIQSKIKQHNSPLYTHNSPLNLYSNWGQIRKLSKDETRLISKYKERKSKYICT